MNEPVFGDSFMRTVRAAFLAAALLLSFGASSLRAMPKTIRQEGAKAPPAAGLDGKELFEGSCARCHGLDAGGEDGPDIRGIPRVLGDQAVENIIKRGIPGTGMPAIYAMTDDEAAAIAKYLGTLGGAGSDAPVTGDPQKGSALFAAKGCSACHIVNGQGGTIGPELSRIGAMRAPRGLRQAILSPGTDLPTEGNILDRGRFTQYLMFQAVPKNGQPVDGMRVTEDTFSITLKDSAGEFHSFKKSDLKSLEKEPGKSFMPSFKGAVSDTELDDLVAYLASLKGAK
jgi:cytochrome c oxidase cbb3-type subunit 3